MFLPDINVWLALTFDSHVHHLSAKTWFDGLPSGAVCVFPPEQGRLHGVRSTAKTRHGQPAAAQHVHALRRKGMEVPVPLCVRHKTLFLWPAILQYGGLFLFFLLGFLVVLAAINGPDSLDRIRGVRADGRQALTVVAGALFMLEPCAWLCALVVVNSRGIRATEITDHSITLTNVSDEFADQTAR
jgi:hypothetical protein